MRKHVLKYLLLACGLVVVAELLFSVFSSELVPSRLTVHPPQQGWRSVTLDYKPLPIASKADCVVPIVYGPHDLQIKLADGKTLWAEFFHSDTGLIRRLDIYVEYVPERDTATLRLTETRYRLFPGVTNTVSVSRVHPKATTPAKPMVLEWI